MNTAEHQLQFEVIGKAVIYLQILTAKYFIVSIPHSCSFLPWWNQECVIFKTSKG